MIVTTCLLFSQPPFFVCLVPPPPPHPAARAFIEKPAFETKNTLLLAAGTRFLGAVREPPLRFLLQATADDVTGRRSHVRASVGWCARVQEGRGAGNQNPEK